MPHTQPRSPAKQPAARQCALEPRTSPAQRPRQARAAPVARQAQRQAAAPSSASAAYPQSPPTRRLAKARLRLQPGPRKRWPWRCCWRRLWSCRRRLLLRWCGSLARSAQHACALGRSRRRCRQHGRPQRLLACCSRLQHRRRQRRGGCSGQGRRCRRRRQGRRCQGQRSSAAVGCSSSSKRRPWRAQRCQQACTHKREEENG